MRPKPAMYTDYGSKKSSIIFDKIKFENDESNMITGWNMLYQALFFQCFFSLTYRMFKNGIRFTINLFQESNGSIRSMKL